jgi:hypothetical protein
MEDGKVDEVQRDEETRANEYEVMNNPTDSIERNTTSEVKNQQQNSF